MVVTDMWMINQEMAELFPGIAVGGPGVNAFTAQIYEELPVAFTRDEHVFIQMSVETGKRAALWGMDQEATREAVERFVKDGLLERFLDLIWKRRQLWRRPAGLAEADRGPAPRHIGDGDGAVALDVAIEG